MSSTEPTLWVKKTKWHLHFAGLNLHNIHASSSLSLPSDPPSWSAIPDAVKNLLLRCHTNGGLHHDYTHCLFRSVSAELSSKPLRFIHKSSYNSYFATWQRFFMYLLRNFSNPEPHHLIISESQRVMLEGLYAYLESTTSVSATAELEDIIFRVSMGIIKQRIVGDPFESPLIHWLGVMGWNATSGIWQNAAEHRPILSRITYCIRILALEDVFSHQDPPVELDHLEHIREYTTQYIHYASPTLFSTLHSQRMYAKAAAKDYYSHPSILWSADKSSLTYKGEKLLLTALSTWMRDIYDQAREILLNELTFQSDGDRYLQSRSPSHFKENMVWSANGQSFPNLNPDLIGQPGKLVLTSLENHPTRRKLFDELTKAGPQSTKGQLIFLFPLLDY